HASYTTDIQRNATIAIPRQEHFSIKHFVITKNVSIFAFIKRTFFKQYIILYINHLKLIPTHFSPSPPISLLLFTLSHFLTRLKNG
ncbi:hypothetical protein, partial [uncultured Bacteroides sp.]|uniref:hypothetical protein n=1 Tax=uncultured Bacteroides sp. TaxID=162156 RepID=UPI0026748AA1